MRYLKNIYRLGIKELWSLRRDPMMLVLIAYTFTVAIYIAATAMPDSLHKAAIAIVDEDRSPLSTRIIDAFYPPHFMPAKLITSQEVDPGMDRGEYTFVLDIPPDFQRDVLAGRAPAMQLNVDATRMSQAFTGNGYINQIVLGTIDEFLKGYRDRSPPPVDIVLRAKFNQSLTQSWFGAIMELINIIMLVSVILTGAALIREREHGTIEHLLVMPVTPFEIMVSKIWSMGLVVLIGTAFCIFVIVKGALQIKIGGSVALFLLCTALYLFATTSLGMFIATIARSMPQFGLLMILVLLPLQVLSGGMTPLESMPIVVQMIMQLAPNTHFVSAAKAILYRHAGFDVVWSQFAFLFLIGGVLFQAALRRFRKTISLMV